MLIVADPVFDASDARAHGAKIATVQQADGDASRGLSFDSALADVSASESGTAVLFAKAFSEAV